MAKTYIIDNNEVRVPFFGDKLSFVTGLDPLGLQNPSVKAYSHLLPGLNNVTGQIRCYSFYCWLLNEYANIIASTAPKEQKKFIRKAEYIIALVSQLGEIPGISGRQYATNRIEEGDIFNLDTGTYNADDTTDRTYWQYHFGVFGQYYIGSMRQIGLIDEPTNEIGESIGIYRRTATTENNLISGQMLSNAFDSELDINAKRLFLEYVKISDTISKEQLMELIPHFNLRAIRRNSEEWTLLTNLLLADDEPTVPSDEPKCFRKQTLKHLLNYARNNPDLLNDREFTMFAYEEQGTNNGEIDECLFGWYYYQFNEYWQVGCTSLFNGCLTALEANSGPGWIPIQELLALCFQLISKELTNDNKVQLAESFKLNDVVINYTERVLYEKIERGKANERLYYGFLLVLKVFVSNRANLYQLNEYAHKYELHNSYDAITYYTSLKDTDKLDLEQFFKKFLLNNIINRHQFVAYRKMGSGSQSTQKFIIEDGLIRQIGNFSPGFTGPRVGNLITFLKDLHLLSESGTITKAGEKIIETT